MVYCHPDPESFASAARDHTVTGLKASGHEVRLIDLYGESFEPALTAEERRTHRDPGVSDPTLQGYTDDLRWADSLVLVYPTWWSGQPAMLKGWFDRVWVAGVAWDVNRRNRLSPRLRNIRRLAVVTTHGSPKLVNALQGEGGKRLAMRSIRSMCWWRARTTWCAMYDIDHADEADRAAFLERVERTFAGWG